MPESPHAGHRERLRARFRRVGLAGFAEHEVLELLLTLAIPRGDVKPAAKRLLGQFGSVAQVLDASAEELEAVGGIGPVAAVGLQLVREVGTLYLREQIAGEEALNSIQQIEDFWRHKLGGLPMEVFEVACVDAHNRLLPEVEDRVAEGDLNAVNVSPRRVIEVALRRNANGLILVHNHPGGVAEPSPADRRLTAQLVKLARPLGLRILDHLIISREAVFSFRRSGFLDED